MRARRSRARLGHGADFVVHSATKYLAGHATVTGGVVVAREQSDAASLIGVMKLVGGILGPWDAHEILRGIKTLPLRMERQCASAARLAEDLGRDKRIKRVYYPAATADPTLRARMLRPPHAGALVTIVLADDTKEGAFRFMDALKLCVRATSLGDVFCTVLHPATASHREMSPPRRQKLGISDGLVRLSVGIEDYEDIRGDLEQALG
jgi:cystathionine beta-lyase/cystathionine gamma-synthase